MPGTNVEKVDMVATALSGLVGLPPYVRGIAVKAATMIDDQRVEINRLRGALKAMPCGCKAVDKCPRCAALESEGDDE